MSEYKILDYDIRHRERLESALAAYERQGWQVVSFSMAGGGTGLSGRYVVLLRMAVPSEVQE